MDIERLKTETQATLMRDRLVLLGLFAVGLLCATGLYYSAPELSAKDQAILYSFPDTPRKMSATIGVIDRYVEATPVFVVLSYTFLYVFLQSFSVPGTVLLNVMAGAVFGFVPAFLLVSFCAGTGACGCYLLVAAFGKGMVLRCFPGLLLKFHQKVQRHQHNLLWYMLSIRVAPIVPKWFTSLASPIVGVPLSTYAAATYIGLMPMNVITVGIGKAISTVKTLQGLEPQHFAILLLIGVLLLLPTLCSRKQTKEE